MRYENIDTKQIIHCMAIIDEDSKIQSAYEDFYKFVGPTIVYLTDAIHQVDMDDFLYVFDNLATNEVKNMVLRIRRFDNTFRWVLVTIEKRNSDYNDSIYYKVELSDIINLNNHYMALTKVFANEATNISYMNIEGYEKGIELAKSYFDTSLCNQVIMMIFSINKKDEIISQYGPSEYESMLNITAKELTSYIGSRGSIFKMDEDKFFIVLKNIGDEKNVRSFLISAMTQLSWLFKNGKNQLDCQFTVGIAENPRNGKDFDIVYEKLLRAYKMAVDKNRNCYVIYKEELHGELN